MQTKIYVNTQKQYKVLSIQVLSHKFCINCSGIMDILSIVVHFQKLRIIGE